MWKWLRNNRLGTYVVTRRFGAPVGEDELGNRYYRRPGTGGSWRDERRWVVYAETGGGELEASSVPPGWNAWLHHNREQAPSEAALPTQRWEKEHQPNLSGTPNAYLPPGHESRGGQRDAAIGDYEAWRPGDDEADAVDGDPATAASSVPTPLVATPSTGVSATPTVSGMQVPTR